MWTAQAAIEEARRLVVVPITRDNYRTVAEMIHPVIPTTWNAVETLPDGRQTELCRIPLDERVAIAQWLHSCPEYVAACQAHDRVPPTDDWSDMVAFCVTRWQMNGIFWKLWKGRQETKNERILNEHL